MFNKVTLRGDVSKEPQLLYVNKKGQSKYQFFVDCKRSSGVIDTLPVITPINDLKIGERVDIYGNYSSFNKVENEKSKLKLNIYADLIEFGSISIEDINEVILEGVICKNPVYRTTPLGREITDILIAVARPESHVSDYIPVILWSANAKKGESLKVGDRIRVTGRIQSRVYHKDNEDHMAYEVSVSFLEILETCEK